MIDVRHLHSMSDFLRNPKAHLVRLKETRTPEVLTVNGRAEVVLLDTDSYAALVERAEETAATSLVRSVIRNAESTTLSPMPADAAIKDSRAVMQELAQETESPRPRKMTVAVLYTCGLHSRWYAISIIRTTKKSVGRELG